MLTFDDFDAWGDAVSGASLRLACDVVEKPFWMLGILDLGGVVLQVASEGGGNVCYGGSVHSGLTLFVPLTHACEHVVNGVPLGEDTLFAIPHGADFSIRVRRHAHDWCSIALPDDPRVGGGGVSERIVCGPGMVRSLRRMVNGIAAGLLDRPPGTAAHRAAGRDLAVAIRACLDGPRPVSPAAIGRPRLDRTAIIRRAMETIESSPQLPAASAIARQIGVNDRTLLRTFHETFGMSPKKYLMLRQLHAVRRVLAAGAAAPATVADVLALHGIWEFGRFAGRYRAHFGELPSQTLQRARA